MTERLELAVHLARDSASGRWYIAESDIPGLWLEADTPAALIDRIALAAPELIELNRHEYSGAGPAAIRPIFDSAFDLAA